MELFFLWVACSVLVAVFASSRDRSGFGWFLLSLFISPLLTLIFLAILPKRGSSAQSLEVPQSLENKLNEIERLKVSGLITEVEYMTKRKLIIESN
jgi:hypothetical protein